MILEARKLIEELKSEEIKEEYPKKKGRYVRKKI